MIRKKMNSTTTAYIFKELKDYDTHVYMIEKPNRVYIIDTFCGPEAMAPIIDDLAFMPIQKEVVVINTHFHWDHIWGNCAFEGSDIWAHVLCQDYMKSQWETQLENNGQFVMGEVTMALPNQVFQHEKRFEDGIRLFHTPGHTADSISVYDEDTQLLIVGDNLELPLIYIENPDIDSYIKSLKFYESFAIRGLTASHTLQLEVGVIQETILYLELTKNNKKLLFDDSKMNEIHQLNHRFIHNNDWIK